MENFKTPLKIWIIGAAVLTLIFGSFYTIGQQILRMDANDPQIQVAQDAAKVLGTGIPPASLVPADSTDMAQSLSPFIMVFDESGKSVATSAKLDGNAPTPPSGVFDTTKKRGEYRVTWQPKKDVRIAAVITHYTSSSGSGYVLVGRSLKEIENRINGITLIALAGWLASLSISLLLLVIFFRPKPELKPEEEKKQ